MQFKEELLSAAEKVYENQLNRKSRFFAEIQNHAIEQIKNGYTMFRVGSLNQEEESFLAEWGKMTNVKIRYIKFQCFASSKKFFVKHYLVNLNAIVQSDCEAEGQLLIFSTKEDTD